MCVEKIEASQTAFAEASYNFGYRSGEEWARNKASSNELRQLSAAGNGCGNFGWLYDFTDAADACREIELIVFADDDWHDADDGYLFGRLYEPSDESKPLEALVGFCDGAYAVASSAFG